MEKDFFIFKLNIPIYFFHLIFEDADQVKQERNKLTGKLMRANLKGDKKKAAEIQVRT